jgi:hypothetical protein
MGNTDSVLTSRFSRVEFHLAEMFLDLSVPYFGKRADVKKMDRGKGMGVTRCVHVSPCVSFIKFICTSKYF